MDKISVIIPIYNVEKYLNRCVDSVLAQSYKNTEIILVDDGSPDGCPAVCDEYAALDNRIRVIHKSNGGLSDARNAGLAIASGELVAFIDSDDWVEPGYLEFMYRAMQQTGADIVECLSQRTNGDSSAPKPPAEPDTAVFTPEEAIAQLIADKVFHQTVWNKLYKHKTIKGLLFPVGRYNEDEFWTYRVFDRAGSIAKLEAVLYNYFQNSSSIMGQGYKLKRLDAVDAKLERQLYIEKTYPTLKDGAGSNLLGTVIYSGQMSLKYLSGSDKTEAMKHLRNAVKTIRTECSFRLSGSLYQRMWLLGGKYFLYPTCLLRNTLGIGF